MISNNKKEKKKENKREKKERIYINILFIYLFYNINGRGENFRRS
jgi:hypothetical protein